MDPLVINISKKKLIGKQLKMSLSDNKTTILWQNFATKKNEIKHKINSDLYSIQVYNSLDNFNDFTPETIFESWAAVLVDEFDQVVPSGMETLVITKGKYAVFTHIGAYATFQKTMQYIYGEWLPNSKYQLDKRPHFQIMDKNYKPNDPYAKETVWVPIY